MKKSIKKNYIYNVFYQILTLLTPLITSPYIARVLGPDNIGKASFIGSITSYFVLFASLGIATFASREISYLQDDRKARTKIFWEVNILQATTASICLAAYIFFALFQENRILYLISAIGILNIIFDVSWLYSGMEEFGSLVLRSTIFKVIHIVYIFTFVRTKDDLVLYMLESAFGLIGSMSLWFKLPKMVGRPVWRELHPFRHMGVILSLFVPAIAVQIYTVLDKTMIGVITHNSFENGYYEQAMRISKMTLGLVTALGGVMVPRIGQLFYKNDIEQVRKYMYRSYRFVWFLGIPLCLGIIMTAGNFIPWFLGDGYDEVVTLSAILSFLILAIGISNVTGVQYLVPTQRQNMLTISVVTGAVINFVCNMFLIRFFQSTGAAIASVVAEVSVSIVQLVIVRKELSSWKILKSGTHYFIAGAIMVVVLFPLKIWLAPSVINTFAMIFSGAAVYFLALFIMKDEFFISNVKNLLQSVKNIKFKIRSWRFSHKMSEHAYKNHLRGWFKNILSDF